MDANCALTLLVVTILLPSLASPSGETCTLSDVGWATGCNCDSVDLSNRGLEKVPTTIYKDVRRVLDLSRNKISRIESDTFVKFQKLESELDLANNTIRDVAPYAFRGLRNVLVISLRGNRLLELVTDSFGGLLNISSLDLSGNTIESIKTNAFRGSSGISVINLSGNKLQTIWRGAFSGLRFVDQLVLTGSDVRNIQARAFDGLSVKRLLMSGMKNMQRLVAHAFSGIQSVVLIDIHGSGVKEIESQAFANMAGDNVTIDLSRGAIEKLGSHVFKNVRNRPGNISLEVIDLTGNKLSTVPYSFFEKMKTDNPGLLLGMNPIVCDCGVGWIDLLMREDDDFYVEMTCEKPDEVKGQNYDDNWINDAVFENCSYNDTSGSVGQIRIPSFSHFPCIFSIFVVFLFYLEL